MILNPVRPVTLQILYYRPDYTSIIQEFVWSYEDHVPQLWRTHKFLWHWKSNIQAVIREINLGVSYTTVRTFRSLDEVLALN
jgi:uncharacterized protein Usg